MNLSKSLSALVLTATVASLSACAGTSTQQISAPLYPAAFTQPIISSLLVPITINGQTYNFVVDTGASLTVIDSKVAKKIGVEPIAFENLAAHHQRDLASMHGVQEQFTHEQFAFLKPTQFNLGPYSVQDNDLWLARDLSLLTESMGQQVDGILGIDTIRQFNWQVDNKKHQLIITKDAPPATSFQQCVGYQDSYNRGPMLYLNYGEIDLAMYIDTGADTSYVGKEFIDFLKQQQPNALHASTEKRVSAGINGNNESTHYLINNLTFNDMPLNVFKADETPINLYALGNNFLQRFDRYVIVPSKMQFCYDATQFAQKEQISVRVVGIRFFEGKIQVFYNQNADIAQYGLKNGDIIKQVNGKAYQPVDIHRVRDLLDKTPKGKLAVEIERDGQSLRLNL